MSANDLCCFVPSNRHDKKGRPQPLDGLNEIVRQSRGSVYAANKRKADNERHVATYVRIAMDEQGWKRPEGRCDVALTFVEVGDKRDPDNIFGAAKFVLDALCTPQDTGRLSRRGEPVVIHRHGCSAIVDDSRAYVRLTCAVADENDRDHPGVWVRLHYSKEDQ